MKNSDFHAPSLHPQHPPEFIIFLIVLFTFIAIAIVPTSHLVHLLDTIIQVPLAILDIVWSILTFLL